ncbi:MAG: NUDIX hydrolase [Paracoccus sp. (in: a-proteobacteria)]
MNDMLRNILGHMLGRRPLALQVGAVCQHPKTGKLLLITSRGTHRWIIPKGWPMAGRSAGSAALQEAWEEAGIRGEVKDQPLGHYRYSKRQDGGLKVQINVQVHLVRVTSLADDFPEAAERNRSWFTPADAADHVDEADLAALLRAIPTQT